MQDSWTFYVSARLNEEKAVNPSMTYRKMLSICTKERCNIIESERINRSVILPEIIKRRTIHPEWTFDQAWADFIGTVIVEEQLPITIPQ